MFQMDKLVEIAQKVFGTSHLSTVESLYWKPILCVSHSGFT